MTGTAVPFDDAVLVRQCQKGDLTAFEPLVVKYQDRIYNLCWRLCGDRLAAEDLTQESFFKAFASLRKFRSQSSFFTWLYRIATNMALSYRRAERHQISVGQDCQWTEIPSQAARLHRGSDDSHDQPDALCHRDEVRRLVWQAIQQLDDEHRAAIVLRDMEGLDYAEIAQVLAVPLGTVKSRLHRARMMVRDKLAPVLNADGGQ